MKVLLILVVCISLLFAWPAVIALMLPFLIGAWAVARYQE